VIARTKAARRLDVLTPARPRQLVGRKLLMEQLVPAKCDLHLPAVFPRDPPLSQSTSAASTRSGGGETSSLSQRGLPSGNLPASGSNFAPSH
jgi:hypothetical protein